MSGIDNAQLMAALSTLAQAQRNQAAATLAAALIGASGMTVSPKAAFELMRNFAAAMTTRDGAAALSETPFM